MQAAGGYADQDVSCTDRATVNDVLALDDADTESGQVEVSRRVQSRHDGRFTADQRQPGTRAAFTHAADNRRMPFRIIPVHCEVIQKKERLRAYAEAVID